MVCCLSCNKEKRMMRDFDEITEVTLDGVQHTDKNDWQCDNEVPDKINDLWTRGEELEAELEGSSTLMEYYNGSMDYASVLPVIPGYLNPTDEASYGFFVKYILGSKALVEIITVDEDLNVLYSWISVLQPGITDNEGVYGYWDIYMQRVEGYTQTRVYYRIFTKQNGDVCIGHGDIRWE